MEAKRRIVERLIQGADLSEEALPKQEIVEIVGDHRVLIENHCGLVHYSREMICVKVRFGTLRICGSSLELARMTFEQLAVTGIIESVTIVKKEDAV